MNTQHKIKTNCPDCKDEIEEIVLRREDGTLMDDEVYCEKCDKLVKIPQEVIDGISITQIDPRSNPHSES